MNDPLFFNQEKKMYFCIYSDECHSVAILFKCDLTPEFSQILVRSLLPNLIFLQEKVWGTFIRGCSFIRINPVSKCMHDLFWYVRFSQTEHASSSYENGNALLCM